MKCDMQPTGETDGTGQKKFRCSRCPKKTGWTPDDPSRIHFSCIGFPHWHEWGHIVAIALAAFGITKTRYGWVVANLQFKEPDFSGCKACERREAWLDSLGGRVNKWATSGDGLRQRVARWVLGIK